MGNNDPYEDFFKPKKISEKGGKGSGNWGHGGLSGVWGGSSSSGSGGSPIERSTRKIMTEEYIKREFGTGQMTTDYHVYKWAKAGGQELSRLGEAFSEKYDEKTINGWLKDTDSVLKTETENADYTKEPSEYVQALLNRREVLNMALSYLKGGGYTIGD